MKNLRKILTLLMVFLLCISSLTCNVYADGLSIYGKTAFFSYDGKNSEIVFDDILNANARGLKKPTKYWDLRNANQYFAQLDLVNASWLYTYYYFKANSDRRIYVCGTVHSNSGRPTVMKIGLYNMSKGKIVATREVESKLEGKYFEYYFYDCYPTTNYAIAFATVYDGFSYDSVKGSAVIYH